MNHEISEKFLSYLDNAEEVATEQVPIIAQEYLNYCFWSSLIWLIVFLSVLVLVVSITRKLYKKADKYDRPIVLAIGLILSLILSISTLVHIDNLIKIQMSPKVFVLEKIARLVKGG